MGVGQRRRREEPETMWLLDTDELEGEASVDDAPAMMRCRAFLKHVAEAASEMNPY